jgi:flagellar basal body P-ring protein FlgI
MYIRFFTALFLICVILNAQQSGAPVSSQSADAGVRLKDLVSIEGVRTNQLVGYGLLLVSTVLATVSRLSSQRRV